MFESKWPGHARAKRGASQLVDMVQSGESCPLVSYIHMLDYGHWCGLGRSGPEDPVDELDACCFNHDM